MVILKLLTLLQSFINDLFQVSSTSCHIACELSFRKP
jgi:hypothetical protein